MYVVVIVDMEIKVKLVLWLDGNREIQPPLVHTTSLVCLAGHQCLFFSQYSIVISGCNQSCRMLGTWAPGA